jgi:hypothetical protein
MKGSPFESGRRLRWCGAIFFAGAIAYDGGRAKVGDQQAVALPPGGKQRSAPVGALPCA